MLVDTAKLAGLGKLKAGLFHSASLGSFQLGWGSGLLSPVQFSPQSQGCSAGHSMSFEYFLLESLWWEPHRHDLFYELSETESNERVQAFRVLQILPQPQIHKASRCSLSLLPPATQGE